MTTTTGSRALDNGLAALAFSRGYLDGLFDGIPEDKLTYQPVDEGNHALWVMGHVAVSDDIFLARLGGRPGLCPKSWNEMFGMGSVPTGDPAAYPPAADVREMYDRTRRALLDWFGGMSEDDLEKPLPEEWREFAANQGVLMSTLAGHEMAHAGQLTMIRRGLGMKPRF